MIIKPCGHNGLSSNPSDYCSGWREMQAEITRPTAERDEARGRAEYWKAEHLAGNAEIERLNNLLRNKGLGQGEIDMLAAQEEEIERLMKIIEVLPHGDNCMRDVTFHAIDCNCPKSEVK